MLSLISLSHNNLMLFFHNFIFRFILIKIFSNFVPFTIFTFSFNIIRISLSLIALPMVDVACIVLRISNSTIALPMINIINCGLSGACNSYIVLPMVDVLNCGLPCARIIAIRTFISFLCCPLSTLSITVFLVLVLQSVLLL